MSLVVAMLAAPGVASAQNDATEHAKAQCIDIAVAHELLGLDVEKEYGRFIENAQNRMNSTIVALVAADAAKKPQFIEFVAASEREVSRLRGERVSTRAFLNKAKSKALRACVAAWEAPVRRVTLAERCGTTGTRATDLSSPPTRLAGDNAEQRRKAAAFMAAELSAKLVTTTWEKLVGASVVESVTLIESIISESAQRNLVVLVEGRDGGLPVRRLPGPRPFDALMTFLDARMGRFGGIFLLGMHSGPHHAAPRSTPILAIHTPTDGRELAALLCPGPQPPNRILP